MEAIGRLAAGIAHEINNPLAIINEKAGLMKDFYEYTGEEEVDKSKFLGLIEGIVESVSRCRTITHRLLGFSRRVDVSYNTIDLNDTVREAIAFVEKEMLYKNIHLEMNLPEDMPSIMSDKGQLQQVFLNIINNAVDAVDKGGTITVTTGIKDENTLTVSIEDNGHGISEHIQKHIFEPFYTTKEKGRGTGLGLSISYGIIKKLGGDIFVRSAVGKGTMFTIEIPVDSGNN
jgi:two-component system NtrC family sensor kinase